MQLDRAAALTLNGLVVAIAVLSCLGGSSFAENTDDTELPSVKILECESACGKWTAPVLVDEQTYFPGSERLQGPQFSAEALVVIRFTVTADGKVADPVVERSIGPQDFADQSLRSILHWRYSPATLNGVPVQRPNELIELVYIFSPKVMAARESVVSSYNRARSLIRDKQYEDAKTVLLAILALPRLAFYEREMTSYLLALDEIDLQNYAAAKNDIDDALLQNGRFLEGGLREGALRMAIRIDAATGQYADALGEFEVLKKKTKIDPDDQDAKVVAVVRARLTDSQPIDVNGTIFAQGVGGVWHHVLQRRNFTFPLTDGKAERFELRCDQQEIASPITDSAKWHVPKDWSGCGLDVFGPSGATFRLEETDD